jgi:hypothetical protein
MKYLLAIGLSFTLIGCTDVPEVQSNDTSGAINTVKLTCKNPYKFEQDCNNWIGASRTIDINGFEVKVGATSKGNVVLVMDANYFGNVIFSNPLVLNSPKHSKAVNNSFNAVRNVLVQNNIKINRARPLKSFGNIDGYILELSGDGYSLLKKYTVDKS